MTLVTPKDCFAFIVQWEGLDQPSKWPGEQSGISLGRGYDLAFVTPDTLRHDWGPHLKPEWITRLSKACGIQGTAARDIAHAFKDIRITAGAADAVLLSAALPVEIAKTARTYPGLDALPLPAQVAIVSLVYNRGTKLTGPRRAGMRGIVDAVKLGNLHEIVAFIRGMKPLWPDNVGLRKRRDAEAAMVESAMV